MTAASRKRESRLSDEDVARVLALSEAAGMSAFALAGVPSIPRSTADSEAARD